MTNAPHDREDGRQPGDRPDVLADIPWERFTEASGPFGLRPAHLLLIVVGVAVLVGLGWFLARSLTASQPPPSAAPAPVSTGSSAPVTTGSSVPVTTVSASPPLQQPTTTMMSYEDLAAGPTDRGIVTLGEWYVRTYLGDPTSVGLPQPERPRYVEWVATRSVSHRGDGQVEVEVLAQSLVETGDGYRREKVRSITVPLEAAKEGWMVKDLPSRIRTIDLEITDPPKTKQPLPPDVAAKAAESIHGTVVGGGRVGDRWRVELTVKGLPIAVEVDDDGKRVTSSRH